MNAEDRAKIESVARFHLTSGDMLKGAQILTMLAAADAIRESTITTRKTRTKETRNGRTNADTDLRI